MSDKDNLFLAAVSQLPRERYPATNGINAAFKRLELLALARLPPHLHPLFVKLRAFCVHRTFLLEKKLHLNPTFRLFLSIRVIPPEMAFVVAAASTVYVLRYLYTHALDLLTNIIGVAYPAYQSIMAIEYGGLALDPASEASGSSSSTSNPLDRALGVTAPNLDKKQWLMYWAIYGVLTTTDHWMGPILRLFPMYRLAKIGVLLWAQHRKYNGATWLYDTFVKPLLVPASQYKQQQQQQQQRQGISSTATSVSKPLLHLGSSLSHRDISASSTLHEDGDDTISEMLYTGNYDAINTHRQHDYHNTAKTGSETEASDSASSHLVRTSKSPSAAFSSLVMPSVWDSASIQAELPSLGRSSSSAASAKQPTAILASGPSNI
ncbi:hypothetical protein GGI12_001155 [Dipsacomyces acuminosporus]|nr:hypothetical protein GGI12_001155 [Dipsacomyces acuminosporus]